jgi:Reverse transcriptase (RNA-dependent DNA polymerase)
VDDILLIGNDILTLDEVKSSLKKVFSMKNLGETVYVLDIKIYRDRSRKLIGLSQGTYIDKVLKRFNTRKKTYPCHMALISAIGSIMYVMICIRPDV